MGRRLGLENWSCNLSTAVVLEITPTGAKVVALRPQTRQQRLSGSAGQVKTPGEGSFLQSHCSFYTPVGHFGRHLLGSFRIKGIRVIKCILRLQLLHKRNPCDLRAGMYYLFCL